MNQYIYFINSYELIIKNPGLIFIVNRTKIAQSSQKEYNSEHEQGFRFKITI